MTDRPYRDYSEAELIEFRRNAEKQSAAASRERERFLTQNARGAGNDAWILEDSDYRSICEGMDNWSEMLSQLNAEFVARQNERKTRRLADEKKSGSGRNVGLVTLTCSCRRPRCIKVTQQVYETGPVICGLCHQPFRR